MKEPYFTIKEDGWGGKWECDEVIYLDIVDLTNNQEKKPKERKENVIIKNIDKAERGFNGKR